MNTAIEELKKEKKQQVNFPYNQLIQVHNTMTKKLEALQTKKPGLIEMFVCGPTVYDYSHLGHAKTYVQFDFIARYLRARGHEVLYLQNITDIDDKIIDRAKARGVSPSDLATEFEHYYLEDMQALHNTSVNIYARAHGYIEQIIGQIERLIQKGYAYKISDGYYFDLSKFPEYGKLSGRSYKRAGDALSRIDEHPEKRNPGDFCLWKARRDGDPFWDTLIGQGRPGWHIEDTAITEHHFGPQYDIHGGAVDLIFPHHEAEIAQIEAASGIKPMVRHWLHTGFLNLKSEKMSKSLGNFITIRQALAKIDYRALRYLFLSHHYRTAIEFGEDSLEQARNSLARIDNFTRSINAQRDDIELEETISKFQIEFYRHLDRDFDTPKALAALFDFIREQNKLATPLGSRVLALMHEINSIFDFLSFEIDQTDTYIEKQISLRQELRKQRRFGEADELRQRLQDEGIVLEDTAGSVRWRRK